MGKDIGALAKIGEEVVLSRLSGSLNNITNGLILRREDLRGDNWKYEFKEGVKSYKENRDKAVSLGLDISDYEKEFSELVDSYSKITGEILK